MAEQVLTTRGLTKRYGHALAADHIDLDLERGQIYGLVGRNGAGKTTIIRMITAQTTPTEGEISLFGARDERKTPVCAPVPGPWWRPPAFIPI